MCLHSRKLMAGEVYSIYMHKAGMEKTVLAYMLSTIGWIDIRMDGCGKGTSQSIWHPYYIFLTS